MEEKLKRILELRKQLEGRIGDLELEIVDEIQENFFDILREKAREISKLENSDDNF